MRIAYRQGLISAQAGFLVAGLTDSRYVDIIVNPTPTVAAVASGSVDYLIVEQRYVSNAWGPFSDNQTHFLYWEINQATGAVTRGSTTLSPLTSASEPQREFGQMWWDVTSNMMKWFNGARWVPVLRVMAGELRSGGIVVPVGFLSQVGLNVSVDAGTIMSDGQGGAYKNAKGEFLTTNTDVTSFDTGSLVRLDSTELILQANENIPKFSLVYIINGRVALASGNAPDDITRAPLAMTTSDAYQNDAVTLSTAGRVVINEQWNWATADIGKSVYCSGSGVATLSVPTSHRRVKVGTITGTQSILLAFNSETDVLGSTGGLAGVGATQPLTITGAADFPIIGLPIATDFADGYISSGDMARITSIESILPFKSDVGHPHPEKSDVGHVHAIPEVTGLQNALNSKSDVGHGHIINDTVGLQSALDSKALINHGHAIADVSGLQPILNNKSDVGHGHVIGDVAGLQIALNNKSDVGHTHTIADTIGLQNVLNSKSDVGHGHVISEVAGLQIVLNNKSDVGHGHAIADTAGLQDALDGKANLSHGHIISSVLGLQDALDSKAAINHTHALSSLSDTLIVSPLADQILKFDGSKWINAAGGGGGSAAPENEIIFGTGTGATSSPNFKFDPNFDLLRVNGTAGAVGDVLTSAGPENAMHWGPPVGAATRLSALLDVDVLRNPNGDSLDNIPNGAMLGYSNALQRWVPAIPGELPTMQVMSLRGQVDYSGCYKNPFADPFPLVSNPYLNEGIKFVRFDSTTLDPRIMFVMSGLYEVTISCRIQSTGEFNLFPDGLTTFGTEFMDSEAINCKGPSRTVHSRFGIAGDPNTSNESLTEYDKYASWTDTYIFEYFSPGDHDCAFKMNAHVRNFARLQASMPPMEIDMTFVFKRICPAPQPW
jgi:hypothetical protein